MTKCEFKIFCSDLPEQIIINGKIYTLRTIVTNHDTSSYKGQLFSIDYSGSIDSIDLNILTSRPTPEWALKNIVEKLYNFGYKHKKIHGRLA